MIGKMSMKVTPGFGKLAYCFVAPFIFAAIYSSIIRYIL